MSSLHERMLSELAPAFTFNERMSSAIVSRDAPLKGGIQKWQKVFLAAGDTLGISCPRESWSLQGILKPGQGVDDRDFKGFPLLLAARSDNNIAVEILLSKRANVDIVDFVGRTAAWMASENGNVDILKMLISSGADVDKPQKENGATPLRVAAECGHKAVVDMLIDAKADIEQCTKLQSLSHGSSPLFAAAQKGHGQVVQALIDARADVDSALNGPMSPYWLFVGYTAPKTGIVPIGIAAANGHKDVVQLLCNSNADIDRASEADGMTPICMAANRGNVEIVKLLASNRADINKTNNNQVTPIKIASEQGHEAVVNALKAAGAHT